MRRNTLIARTVMGAVLLSVAGAASARTINCASRNYEYEYCRVDTRGGVRLVRQISNADCRQGRSWGFDRNGIWVDDGCEAHFQVGGGSGGSKHQDRHSSNNHNRDDDDDDDGPGIGTAAAVVGGAALIGALLGGNQADPYQQGVTQDYGQQPSYGQPSYGQQPSYGYGQPQSTYGNLPNWAVGTFRGFSPVANTEVELLIRTDGSVTGYANGQQVDGYYQDGRLVMAGVHYYLESTGRGIRTLRVDGNGQPVNYQRIR